jgi:hypothetical protein
MSVKPKETDALDRPTTGQRSLQVIRGQEVRRAPLDNIVDEIIVTVGYTVCNNGTNGKYPQGIND